MARSPSQALSVALICVGALAASEPARAQTSDTAGVRHSAHLFVSNGAKVKRLGGARSLLQFGFGMEWLHRRGLGLGFDVGPRFEDHDFMRLDDIMVSVAASYHPRVSSGRRVDPFLNGGVAFGVEPTPDGQHVSFVSVGGGVTYWLADRRGIRLELRDAVTVNQPNTGYHAVSVRVGYAWLMGR